MLIFAIFLKHVHTLRCMWHKVPELLQGPWHLSMSLFFAKWAETVIQGTDAVSVAGIDWTVTETVMLTSLLNQVQLGSVVSKTPEQAMLYVLDPPAAGLLHRTSVPKRLIYVLLANQPQTTPPWGKKGRCPSA